MKHFIITILCTIYSSSIFSQQILEGTVIDSSGQPIPGVTIRIKDFSIGTLSDFDGNYNLEVRPKDIIVIEFIGMQTQQFEITPENFRMLSRTNASLDTSIPPRPKPKKPLPKYYDTPTTTNSPLPFPQHTPSQSVVNLDSAGTVKFLNEGKKSDSGSIVIKDFTYNTEKKKYTYSYEYDTKNPLQNFELKSQIVHNTANRLPSTIKNNNFFNSGIHIKNNLRFHKKNISNGYLFAQFTNIHNNGIAPKSSGESNTVQIGYKGHYLNINTTLNHLNTENTLYEGNFARLLYSSQNANNKFTPENTFSESNSKNYSVNVQYKPYLRRINLLLQAAFLKNNHKKESGFFSEQLMDNGFLSKKETDDLSINGSAELKFNIDIRSIGRLENKISYIVNHREINNNYQLNALQLQDGKYKATDELLLLNPQNTRTTHEVILKNSHSSHWFRYQAILNNYKSTTIDKVLISPSFSAEVFIGRDQMFRLSAQYIRSSSEIQQQTMPYHFNTLNFSFFDFFSYHEKANIILTKELSPAKKENFQTNFSFSLSYPLRLTLKTSYHRKYTYDAIFPFYNNDNSIKLSNTANLETQGGEVKLILGHTIHPLNGTTSIGFSRSITMVNKIHSKEKTIPIAGFSNVHKSLIKGKQAGVIVGSKYARTEDGEYILDTNGKPTLASDLGIIANPNPDWKIIINNRFSYRKLTIIIDTEYKKGGQVWNGTKHFSHPQAKETAAEEFVEDASWFRINSVSLNYKLKDSKLGTVFLPDMNLGLWATNLIVHTPYSGVDPQSLLFGYGATQGMDLFNMPNSRRIGFKLNIAF